MELTKELKNKYIDSGGNECPHCDESDLEAGKFNADGTSAWRPVECINCGEEWNDVYMLIDIE